MSEQFDFDKVLAALQKGQDLTGKDGILSLPLKKFAANPAKEPGQSLPAWHGSPTLRHRDILFSMAWL